MLTTGFLETSVVLRDWCQSFLLASSWQPMELWAHESSLEKRHFRDKVNDSVAFFVAGMATALSRLLLTTSVQTYMYIY